MLGTICSLTLLLVLALPPQAQADTTVDAAPTTTETALAHGLTDEDPTAAEGDVWQGETAADAQQCPQEEEAHEPCDAEEDGQPIESVTQTEDASDVGQGEVDAGQAPAQEDPTSDQTEDLDGSMQGSASEGLISDTPAPEGDGAADAGSEDTGLGESTTPDKGDERQQDDSEQDATSSGPATSKLPGKLVGKRLYLACATNAARMLTTARGATSNKTRVVTDTYRASNAFRWKLVASGKYAPDGSPYYYVMRWGTNQVLHVSKGSAKSGTSVRLYRKYGSAAQLWAVRLDEDGNRIASLVSALSYRSSLGYELVLDVRGGSRSNANQLVIRRADKATDQGIMLLRSTNEILRDGCYRIMSARTKKLSLEVRSGSKKSGATLRLVQTADKLRQKFWVHVLSDGSYRIQTGSSGGWLASSGKNKAVIQHGSSSTKVSDAQRWRLGWSKGSFWVLCNVKTGQVLDLSKGKVQSGAKLVTAASNGNARQHFVFSRTDLISEGVYTITSAAGERLTIDADYVTMPGAKVQTAQKSAESRQRFVFQKQDGGYRIINAESGLALSVGDMSAGGNVSQRRLRYGAMQIWDATIANGGAIHLTNRASQLALATKGSAGAVAQRALSNNATRSWKLSLDTKTTPASPTQPEIRVLMIGNSFTLRTNATGSNNLPEVVQNALNETTSSEVVAYTRQGCTLSYQLRRNSKALLKLPYLASGSDWDYVVIQEQSTRPIDKLEGYLDNLQQVVSYARACGATPIIYGTWAYEGVLNHADDVEAEESALNGALSRGISLQEMHEQLQASFALACDLTGTLLANVGQAFADTDWPSDYYSTDMKHLAGQGVALAAQVISSTILAAAV